MLVTSEVVFHELNAITSIDKREKVLSLLLLAREHVILTPEIHICTAYNPVSWFMEHDHE